MDTCNKLCRFCLSVKANKNLDELPEKIDVTQTYDKIILFCLDIKVTNESKLSTKLCTTCFKKIVSFSKFKALAIKNDAHLNSLRQSLVILYDVDIKAEDKLNSFNNAAYDTYNDDYMLTTEHEVKDEVTPSDDEILSVIQNIKYEFIETGAKNPELNESEMPKKRLDTCVQAIKNKSQRYKTANNIMIPDDNLKLVTAENIKSESKDIGNKNAKHRKVRQKWKNKSKIDVPKVMCEECGKTVRDIAYHMSLHNPSLRKIFKCQLCDKVFHSHSGRAKHIKLKHKGLKQFCTICNKAKTNLKNHILSIHKYDELKIQCFICSRRFLNQGQLKSHMLRHNEEMNFECDDCQKKFSFKTNLALHIRRVHLKEKTHLCQYCSKSFFKESHLAIHLRMHTKEKPYKCEDCGKAFNSPHGMRKHQHLHTGIKNYKCEVCGHSFAHKAYLKRHMVVHTKIKRFPCKYCGIMFGRQDHRRNHERSAHEKHLPMETLASG